MGDPSQQLFVSAHPSVGGPRECETPEKTRSRPAQKGSKRAGFEGKPSELDSEWNELEPEVVQRVT